MNLREMTLPDLASEYWRRQYLQDDGYTEAAIKIMAEFARRQAMLDAAGQVAQVVRDSVISGRTMDDGKLVA